MTPKAPPYAPLFRNYQLGVQILTPVHVGIGADQAWQLSTDYVFEQGQVRVINPAQLHRQLQEEPGRGTQSLLDEYLGQLSRSKLDHQRIGKLLREADLDWEAMIRHTFDHSAPEAPAQIQRQIRTGHDELYLPGSSIKGAIHSAIFAYLYQALFTKQYHNQLESNLIGDFERSLMRYIRPYDVPFAHSELIEVFVFNLYREDGGWVSAHKDMLPLTLESLPVGARASRPMRFSLATGFLDLIAAKQPDLLPTHLTKVIKREQGDPLPFLFELINRHTRTHLEKELAFFHTYDQAVDIELVIEEMEQLLAQVKSMPTPADRCLLRLAWGSGYHAMTGDYRFDDHRETIDRPDDQNRVYSQQTRQQEPARYKSRRLAEKGQGAYYAPMGFVELSLT
jgi:CRISPR/Cas system CSM-associated protein Csm5 (group 7 of RAMP superfamily)